MNLADLPIWVKYKVQIKSDKTSTFTTIWTTSTHRTHKGLVTNTQWLEEHECVLTPSVSVLCGPQPNKIQPSPHVVVYVKTLPVYFCKNNSCECLNNF